MSEQDASAVTCPFIADGSVAQEKTRTNSGFLLSILGLIVSVIAIGLASIPTIAFDRPLLNPFGEQAQKRPEIEQLPEREGGVTFKFKDISVNFGGKAPQNEPVVDEAPPPQLTKDPIRWFSISAIASALVGLVISSVAHVQERHTAFTVGSMGCCAAAITWQYVAIGIAVGVGAAIFLVVLGALASAGAT